MGTDDSKTPKRGPRGGTTTITKRGLVRFVVYLHADERKALKLAAVEEDVSASEIVRRMLREHLDLED